MTCLISKESKEFEITDRGFESFGGYGRNPKEGVQVFHRNPSFNPVNISNRVKNGRDGQEITDLTIYIKSS